MRLHHFLNHLHALVDVVVTRHRRHDLDPRIILHPILETTNPLLQVEGPRHSRQQRHLPRLAHRPDQHVCRCQPTFVVVHSQIGEPPTLRRIRIPRHHRDPGIQRLLDRIDTRRRVVTRNPDRVHSLRDHVLYHARLLRSIRCYRPHVVHAHLHRTTCRVDLLRLLERPVSPDLEHRIVQRLRNPRDRHRVLGKSRRLCHHRSRYHHREHHAQYQHG